jgi:hypothetical protein
MQDITEQIAALTEERNAIAQDGYILGYITASHPGNRPNFTQYHLREYGQKVGKYISKKRLAEVRLLVARGQQIKELDEAIAKLQAELIVTNEPSPAVVPATTTRRRRNAEPQLQGTRSDRFKRYQEARLRAG